MAIQKHTNPTEHLFAQLTNSQYLYNFPFDFEQKLPNTNLQAFDNVYCTFAMPWDDAAKAPASNELFLTGDLPTYLSDDFKIKLLLNNAEVLRNLGFSLEQIKAVARVPNNTEIRDTSLMENNGPVTIKNGKEEKDPQFAIPFTGPREVNYPKYADQIWYEPVEYKSEFWLLDASAMNRRVVPGSGNLGLELVTNNGRFLLLYQRSWDAKNGAGHWQIGGGMGDRKLRNVAFTETGEENGLLQIEWRNEKALILRPMRFEMDGEVIEDAILKGEIYRSNALEELDRLLRAQKGISITDINYEWAEPIALPLELLGDENSGLVVRNGNGDVLERVPGKPGWQHRWQTRDVELAASIQLKTVDDLGQDSTVVCFCPEKFNRRKGYWQLGMDLAPYSAPQSEDKLGEPMGLMTGVTVKFVNDTYLPSLPGYNPATTPQYANPTNG